MASSSSKKRHAESEEPISTTSKRPRRNSPPPIPSSVKGKGKEKADFPDAPAPVRKKLLRNKRSRRGGALVTVSDSPAVMGQTVVPVAGPGPSSSGVSPSNSDPTLVPSDLDETGSLKSLSTDSAAANAANDEIARLRKELKAKNDLITKHQETFSALQGTLSCQICMEVMRNPYITPCGHTSCLSCLQAWFKAPPPEDPHNHPLAPHLRKKTCPTCRAAIHSRPTPVFILKGVVGSLRPYFDQDEASAANATVIIPGGGDADVWDGIFPPSRAHIQQDVPGVLEDNEDGVLRCVDCMYEIFDGACQGCGRIFDDLMHDGGFTDDEEDGEGPVYPAFEWEPDYLPQYNRPVFARPWMPHLGAIDDEDDYESDSETGSEMDDFIDRDRDEHRERIGRVLDNEVLEAIYERQRRLYEEVEADSEVSESEDEEPPAAAGIRHRQPYRPPRRPHLILSSDSESGSDGGSDIEELPGPDAEEEQRIRQQAERDRHRDYYGDDEPIEIPPPVLHARHGPIIEISDDESAHEASETEDDGESDGSDNHGGAEFHHPHWPNHFVPDDEPDYEGEYGGYHVEYHDGHYRGEDNDSNDDENYYD